MFCKVCGGQIKEGTKFCTTCGSPVPVNTAPVQMEAPSARENSFVPEFSNNNRGYEQRRNDGREPQMNRGPQPQMNRSPQMQQPQASFYRQDITPDMIPEEYKPISMWGYFGYELLFAIPLVGFIMLLVFSFGGTSNKNLKNFARSYFCMLIVAVIVAVILGSVLGGVIAAYL